MVIAALALNIGYFASSLLLLGILGSVMAEPAYVSHVSATSFDSTNTEITTIVHRTCANHSKFFVAQCYGVNLLVDLVLGICWLYQNRLGRFCKMNFIVLWLLAILVPKRFVLYCLGMFGSPLYYCLANRLYIIMLFTIIICPLLSIGQVFCSHYLFQKASLCPGVLALSWTCLFVML